MSARFQPQEAGPLQPDGNIQVPEQQVESQRTQNVVPSRRRITSTATHNNMGNSPQGLGNSSQMPVISQKVVSLLDAKGKVLRTSSGYAASVPGKDSKHSDAIINDPLNTDKVVAPDVNYSHEVEVFSSMDNNSGFVVGNTNATSVGDSGLPSTISSKDLQLLLERVLQNDTGDDIQVEIGPENAVIINIKHEKTQTKQERKRPIKKEGNRIPKYKKQKRSPLYRLEPGVSSTEYLEKMRCPNDINSIVTPSGHKFPFPVKFPGPRGRGQYKCPVQQCPFRFATGHVRHFVENHLERHVKVFICQTPGK